MTKNINSKVWTLYTWTDGTKRTYPQTNPAATPTFSPAAGSYSGSQTVTISCSTAGSTIYYTTNGTPPTTSSTVYTTPFTVSASETVHAIATAPGYTQSAVGSATYAIGVSGYLAAGHWITKQALRVVYPRPDTETNTWASHHYAYWDGTTGVQYRRPIGVSFGGYPYVYQLIAGPTGMTLVTPTVIGSSPPYPCAYVQWTPTAIVTNQTVTVRVFGQDYQNDGTSYVDVTWTVSTSSSTAQFIFVDSLNGNDTNAGTISAPLKTLTGAFGTTSTSTTFPSATCYIRQGSAVGALALMGAITGGSGYTNGTYTSVPLTGGTGTGAQATIIVAGGVVTSVTIWTVAGSGYTVGDSLSAAASNIGGTGSGFSVLASTVASYAFPIYTDISAFRFATTLKPAAVIAYPGESPTVDATIIGMHSLGSNPDLFLQGFASHGSNTALTDYKLFASFGAGDDRMTFDGLTWDNGGYGSLGNDIPAMFSASQNNTQNQYWLINNCSDNNHQSGNPGNNYGLGVFYTLTDVLVQGCAENSPTASFDGVAYFKSDIVNGCMRGNFNACASTPHSFSFGQAPYGLMGNSESCHNIGVNGGAIQIPDTGGYTLGNLWAYRNNILAGTSAGLSSAQTSYNLVAPYGIGHTATGSTGLAAGTYYHVVTALGVTGESTPYGGLGGGHNEVSTTLSAPGEIALTWPAVPGASGYNVYRGTSAGAENVQFSVGNVTAWTDTGAAGTSATPPTINTAVSAARFDFSANAVQTSHTGVPPTGSVIDTPTLANVVTSTGLLDSATGLLTSAYSSDVGTVGAQIA